MTFLREKSLQNVKKKINSINFLSLLWLILIYSFYYIHIKKIKLRTKRIFLLTNFFGEFTHKPYKIVVLTEWNQSHQWILEMEIYARDRNKFSLGPVINVINYIVVVSLFRLWSELGWRILPQMNSTKFIH